MKKRLLAGILTLVLAATLVVPAIAADTEFIDVQETDWCYTYVIACAEKGLISGVGANRFAPNATMTRAEFLTVIVRYLYPDTFAIKSYPAEKEEWWTSYYNIALWNRLTDTTLFPKEEMNKGISRQEMALLISHALVRKGHFYSKVVDSSQIADYAKIDSEYQDAVKTVYTAGILTGIDSKGTFDPTGTLTRGQACTVLYKLVEMGTKKSQQSTTTTEPDENGYITIGAGSKYNDSWGPDNRFTPGETPQEWVEGQPHKEPRIGDVVIKADGTRVILEAALVNDLVPVLGVSPITGPQGVDPYTGWGSSKVGGLSQWDAQRLLKDPVTGSVFSWREWIAMQSASYPNYKGKTEGEISTNGWFQWESITDTYYNWTWIGPFPN